MLCRIFVCFFIIALNGVLNAQAHQQNQTLRQYGLGLKTTHPIGTSALRYGLSAYAMYQESPNSKNYFHFKLQYLFPYRTSERFALREIDRFNTLNPDHYLYHDKRSSVINFSFGGRYHFASTNGTQPYIGQGPGLSLFMIKAENHSVHHAHLNGILVNGRHLLLDAYWNGYFGYDFKLKNKNQIFVEFDLDFYLLRYGHALVSIFEPISRDPVRGHFSALQLGVKIGYTF